MAKSKCTIFLYFNMQDLTKSKLHRVESEILIITIYDPGPNQGLEGDCKLLQLITVLLLVTKSRPTCMLISKRKVKKGSMGNKQVCYFPL
jgi:hypothetical protein